MKPFTLLFTALLLHNVVYSQSLFQSGSGTVSLGTRNTLSSFNHDNAAGKGIGGQIRLQLSKSINSEWFLDYIISKTNLTARNDYHIGWSLMFYMNSNNDFTGLLQPYFIAGHCFDKTTVFERSDPSNNASRLSMATQAGLGSHINITPRFDCSVSGQYMLHFGKDIETKMADGKLSIQKSTNTGLDGHLLCTLSFNYKLKNFW
jgi:hypothetical protein